MTVPIQAYMYVLYLNTSDDDQSKVSRKQATSAGTPWLTTSAPVARSNQARVPGTSRVRAEVAGLQWAGGDQPPTIARVPPQAMTRKNDQCAITRDQERDLAE